MSWPQGQGQHGAVTSELLEERINMYISAMDRASAVDDSHQSSQLQRDIQRLVDLMEKVSAGYAVTEREVPPPLAITPQIDVLANPLGELSSRLADYHKALYFAEEELSENRINKIQNLQMGLKTIHDLQKRAQAGFPVRMDEVPPPVKIPTDDELDNDAVNTLTARISSYKAALVAAQQSQGFSDRRRVPKIESALRKLEFLMTRAKAKRPVWKRDILLEFEYYDTVEDQGKPVNKTKKALHIRLLRMQLEKLVFSSQEHRQQVEELTKKLDELDSDGGHPADDLISSISKQIEKLKKLEVSENEAVNNRKRDLALIEARISEYKAAALNSKREKQNSHAIQHLKIVKSLVPLKESLERGVSVDMTLVPPPPRELTPASELPPPISELETSAVGVAAREPTQSAMAHISTVNIKPAVETAEDKLAKRLTSYLDKGDDSSDQIASSKNLNLHPTPNSSSPAQLLPKIPNSLQETKTSTSISEDRTGFSLNNVASLSCDNGSSMGNNSSTERESLKPQLLTNGSLQEVSKVESSVINSDQETKNSTNIEPEGLHVSEPVPEEVKEISTPEPDTGGHGVGAKAEEKEREVSHQNTPASPPKSSDVYTRKTLDSVGFLSCQNVPEQIASPMQQEQISNVKEQKTQDINTTVENSEAFVPDSTQDETSQLSISGNGQESNASVGSIINANDDRGPLSSLPQYGTETRMDNIENRSMEDGVSPTYGLSELGSREDTLNNGLKIQGDPASLPLPVSSRHNGSDSFQNEPSSLPVSTMVREDVGHTDVKPLTSDLPHIPVLANNTSINDTNMPSKDSNESPMKEQITVTSNKPQNSQLSAGLLGSPTGIVEQNEHLINAKGENLNETEEFEDLMSSMVMPSMSASAALPNSVSKPEQKSEGEQANASQDWKPELSGTQVKPPASFDENLYSDSEKAATHDGPYGPESHVSSVTGSQSMSVSTHVFHQDVAKPTNDRTSNSFNSPAVWNSQCHNSKGPDARITQPSPFSMTPQSVSSRVDQPYSLPEECNARREVQSGVTFTCLENLKYDCLLREAKGSEADSEGTRRLKSDMEQIKYKLRNGGRQLWEVYKACVESELRLLQQELSEIQSLQQCNDSKVQVLRDKKNIAQRELTILQQRLPQIKY